MYLEIILHLLNEIKASDALRSLTCKEFLYDPIDSV